MGMILISYLELCDLYFQVKDAIFAKYSGPFHRSLVVSIKSCGQVPSRHPQGVIPLPISNRIILRTVPETR